jgi:hypothetical protein
MSRAHIDAANQCANAAAGIREECVKRTSLNRIYAKKNPARVFDSPSEIVDELLLTRGEKLGTLDRWRQSILDQLDGHDAERRGYAGSSQLLGQIEEAKLRLSTGLP